MPSVISRRQRSALAICAAVFAASCAAPAVAIVEGDQPTSITLDPNTAGSKSKLSLDSQPPQSQDGQKVKSLILTGPRGLKVDPRSRSKRCSDQQARDFKCPAKSKIGSGEATGHASGAVVPGGRQDFTAKIETFLAAPVRSGDIAGVVLQITEPQSGNKGTVTGRIVPVKKSKRFGMKLRFDDFPAPPEYPGVTITVDRITLLTGARRGRFSLLTNPAKCRGGSWPFRVEAVYADHTDRADVPAACKKH